MIITKRATTLIFLATILSILCGLFAYNRFFSLSAKLNNYVAAYAQLGQFSGAALVAKDGKILLSKGYGMADYELDVPNTPKTKFRLGSITKQFTALAIMQLQEQGKLNVNHSISKYLPDYPQGKKITIHHLLTHTAGIPNFTRFPEYKNIQILPTTPIKTMDLFKNKPLEFVPGEKHAYSNSGYIILAAIIEQVSGQEYEKYMDEHIFHPLEMKDTGYDHDKDILKNRASGYAHKNEQLVNAHYIDMSLPSGAGALYSTVEDVYRWDRALYKPTIVKESTLQKIFTPFKDDYGYGWSIQSVDGIESVQHNGGIDGFRSIIKRYPKNNICIIILSNFEFAPVDEVAEGLAKIIFGKEPTFPQKHVEIDVDPKVFDDYIGKYELKKDFVITVTKENKKLYAQATKQDTFQMYPEKKDLFFIKAVDAQIAFVRNKDGIVTSLILHQNGKDRAAQKVE
jgi:CubicO group peptidase (beta-lactamase class C family)